MPARNIYTYDIGYGGEGRTFIHNSTGNLTLIHELKVFPIHKKITIKMLNHDIENIINEFLKCQITITDDVGLIIVRETISEPTNIKLKDYGWIICLESEKDSREYSHASKHALNRFKCVVDNGKVIKKIVYW